MTTVDEIREALAAALFEAERPEGWPTWEDYLASFAHPPTQEDVWLRRASRVLARLTPDLVILPAAEVERLRAALEQIATLKPKGMFRFPTDELIEAQEIGRDALDAPKEAEHE